MGEPTKKINPILEARDIEYPKSVKFRKIFYCIVYTPAQSAINITE